MKDETMKVIIDCLLWTFASYMLCVTVYMICSTIIAGRKRKKREMEKVQRFVVSANVSKGEADKNGIEYAFGKAECDERNRIREAIDGQSHRGLYTCELDFPISQRSLEWLQYGGFEVSQSDDGKTQVSWESAKY